MWKSNLKGSNRIQRWKGGWGCKSNQNSLCLKLSENNIYLQKNANVYVISVDTKSHVAYKLLRKPNKGNAHIGNQ